MWEERWRVAADKTEQELLQGLIQVAAAFHKLLAMKSPESATRLLARGLAKLDPCAARVPGVDLEAFCKRLHACADDLAAGRLTHAAIPKMDVGDLAAAKRGAP